jgi:hypothetical protein
LTLREKIVELQSQVDSSKKVVVEHVQEQLASKLEELQHFVTQLSTLSHPISKPLPDYPQPQTALKGFKRNFRTPLELLDEQEAYLPTIREDKQWPRKTLE